ncbi:MAG: rod shape-determining protein MreD [Actinobacteria bacterium]|uniref:Unannotated protein n=1 Tax=freshwater metagenome TaxID=449393 RepID=A0A6J7EKY6_9ZZZZ|nr:rod shape-determining protein MreD [Actinomycetota bacterium]
MATVSSGNRIEVPRGRLVLAGAVGLILQVSLVSQVSPFSGSADIVALVVMSVGLLFGSLPGAVFGFSVGVILDLLLIQTLGQYALMYLAVGYGAGRLMELRAPSGRLVLLPLGAAATATVTLGFGLLQVLLGGGANLNVVVLRQTALAVLWGALLAVPVDAMVRKIVVVRRKARPDTSRSGRSHAYATGGLSPLTPGRKK